MHLETAMGQCLGVLDCFFLFLAFDYGILATGPQALGGASLLWTFHHLMSPSLKEKKMFDKMESLSQKYLLIQMFQVSRTLSSGQISAVFQKFDENRDGRLSKKEFRKLMDRQ